MSTSTARRDRPYQITAKLKMSEAYDDPQRRNTVLSLPPSGGKTYTTTSWLRDRVLDAGKRVLWVVHRDELVNQAAVDFLRQDVAFLARIDKGLDERDPVAKEIHGLLARGHPKELFKFLKKAGWSPTFPVSIWKGDQKDATAQIVIASNQSGISLVNWLKLHPEFNNFAVQVVDECHHAAGATYERLREEVNFGFYLGLSGTPKRHDDEDFGFDHVCYQVSFPQLFLEGWCARPVYKRCRTKQTHLFSTKTGEYSKKSLKSLNNAPRNEFVAKLFFDHRNVAEGEPCPCVAEGGKQCDATWWPGLFFCVDISHVYDLVKALNEEAKERKIRFSAKVVTGETDPQIRRDIVTNMRAGRVDALINCEVFTEGTDIPQIRSIQLCRPTASETLWLQMALRGGRSFPQYAATGTDAEPGRNPDNHFYLVDYVDSVQHYENVSRGWALKHLDNEQATIEIAAQDEFAKAHASIAKAKKDAPEADVDGAMERFRTRFSQVEYEESGLTIENFVLSQVASLLITSSKYTDNETRVLTPDEDMAVLLGKEYLDRRLTKWTKPPARKAAIGAAYKLFGARVFRATEWNAIMYAYVSHSVYKDALNDNGSRIWLHLSGMQSPPMQEVSDRIEEIEEELAAADSLFPDTKVLWDKIIEMVSAEWPSPAWAALNENIDGVRWQDKVLHFNYTGGPLTEQAYWLEAVAQLAIRHLSKIDDARCQMDFTRTQTEQPCPECKSGKLIIRRAARGGRFLSCNRFPDCRGTDRLLTKDECLRKVNGLLKPHLPPGA